MANCVQCGRQIPSFSFGDFSDRCSDCRRQQQPDLQQHAVIARPSDVPAEGAPPVPQVPPRKPTMLETAQAFPVTAAIVAINLAVYVACAIASVTSGMGSPMDFNSRMLLRFGADYGPLTLDKQWWRLFTSMWLHGGLIHVAANMYGLWNFGRITERIYGRQRYLAIYLITGLASSLASVGWHSEPTVSVGASGAIFGVVGALVWPFYRKRLKMPPAVMSAMLRNIGTVIVINLIIGASIPVIDNAAHVGGLVAGLILGALFVEIVVAGGDSESSLWKVSAASVIVLAAAFAGIQHERLPDMLPWSSFFALERGDTRAAMDEAQRAVQLRPKSAMAHASVGEVYLHLEKYPEAAKEYEIAHQLSPEDGVISGRLGGAYAGSKQWTAAEPLLREGMKADPKDPDVLIDLGVTLAWTNRVTEGLEYVHKALQIQPQSARGQYALGLILEHEGRYREALPPLQEAVKLDPNDAEYRAELISAEKAVQAGDRKAE